MSHESRWNHEICEACWMKREGEHLPVRVLGDDSGKCCFCSAVIAAGNRIYVRLDPTDPALRCNAMFSTARKG